MIESEPGGAAFAQRIIGGPGSFVITAAGDDNFADAVRKKLVLEIARIFPHGPQLAQDP